MTINWQQLFAERTARMQASDIREILKVIAQPDIISLAGGLPAPELFPVDHFRRAFEWVWETNGQAALQYSITEGYPPLRQFLAARMARTFGIRTTAEEILITNGSQQGLDLLGKIFLDPGDKVALERPSYLGAIQAFDQYQAEYAIVPMDEDGMQTEALEELLQRETRVKLIYAVPNFQNPSGRTMSLERRQHLVRLSAKFGVPVVEDDPYGELRYEGEPLPSLKSLDTAGSVIYLGTFSKILAPGFRLGWVVASGAAYEQLVLAKQPTDLQTATASQMAFYEVCKDGFVDQHVERIKEVYGERRLTMLRAMQTYFPEGVRWSNAQGGLFFWVMLPEHIDARELLVDAIKEKVAFVAGQAFHADGSGRNTMRLNFSNATPEKLEEAIKRLGRTIERRVGVTNVVRG
ncbi:MAG: PLP-dependent aminotransferase family protein [Chloroflexi bacterium]|nr:PLP-dependent aminotransferase family protein [Chloroflexota bacterium]